jgi:integrase
MARSRGGADTDPTAQVFFQERERGPWPTSDDKRYYDRILSAMQTAAHRYSGLGETEVGTHDFRHSRLVHLGEKMLDDGHSYPEVRERLQKYGRHHDQDTTEIYIGILKNRDTIDLRKYDEE